MMDWSKSKSIFIFVFLILNVFLYTQYLGVYTQGQQVGILGEKTIETELKDDNITYIELPNTIKSVSYISGKVRQFNETDFPKNSLMDIDIEDQHLIKATFNTPIELREIQDQALVDFVNYYVDEGDRYVLWEVNEENRYALFFQRINDRTLYYNVSGFVKIYWNEDEEVYKYEQTMLEKIEELEQEEVVFSPIQVIRALYLKNLLNSNSHVTSMNLGYSTLVQLKQSKVFVFAPTWEVRVRTEDGENEEHFVNAVEGKVIDIQLSSMEKEEEE